MPPRCWPSCQAAYDQAAQSGGVTGGQPLGTVDVTEQAFRWITYTPAAAILDLVGAGPGGSGATVRASVQMEVVWDGGRKVVGGAGTAGLEGGRPARR